MLLKRIIPKIEFKGHNLIKGLEFEGNRSLGTVCDFTQTYLEEKTADEIFFYDIVASLYNREFSFDTILNIDKNFNIPATFCGGINSIKGIEKCLLSGADKVSINTYLTKNREFLKKAINIFGSPTLISNVEYYIDDHKIYLMSEFGRSPIDQNIFEWVDYLQDNGVGELHFLDVKNDGHGSGINIDFINKITKILKIPFVVGCGYGSKEHVLNVFKETDASGVSISSLFHYYYQKKLNKPFASSNSNKLRLGKDIDSGNIEFLNYGYGGLNDIFVDATSIKNLKTFLRDNKIPVRI